MDKRIGMKRYALTYHPMAQRMLESIYEWGVHDSGARAAQKFLKKLVGEIKSLCEMPTMGAFEPMLQDRSFGYRSFVVHRYFKVIYLIDEAEHAIRIVDIWDTRMNTDDLQSHIDKKL